MFAIRRLAAATFATLAAVTAVAAQPASAEAAPSAPTATAEAKPVTADIAAGCAVGNPRVRYWCDTVHPLTAYTNYSSERKEYNEMYEGGSLPVGIYMESDGQKFHVLNGTGYVYKTVPSTTAWALCWNRSSSVTSSAHCDYVRTV